MSKIGKLPIKIPVGVKVDFQDKEIKVSGPKGEIGLTLPPEVEVKIDKDLIICQASKTRASLWGLTRTLIANAIVGVTSGWTKTLELIGVGFRALVEGDELILTIGFSHPVKFKTPEGINFTVVENKIHIAGVDKQLVGEVAAKIRRFRPPEPYKGKGIKYQDEKIRRKLGKVAKALGAVATTGGK